MKRTRRSIKFVDLSRSGKAMFGAWWRLARQLVVCVGLTLQWLFIALRWTLRQLTPAPRPAPRGRYRPVDTGLNISPVDVAVVTFTLIVLATQSW